MALVCLYRGSRPPPPVKLKYSKLPEGRRASCCDRARTGRVGGHGDFGRPGTRIIHQMMQKSRPIFSKDEKCKNVAFCLKVLANMHRERMLILLKIALFQQKFPHYLLSTNWLKYGFCKKLSQYKWSSDKLNTFSITFWPVCCAHKAHTANWPKQEEKEVHLYQSNFLQNPYFRSWRLKTNWKQKRADNKKEQRWMGLDSIIDGKAVTIMTFFFFFFSHCCQSTRFRTNKWK